MSVKVFTGNENIRDSDGTLIVGLMVRRTIRQQSVTVGTSAIKIPTSPLSNRVSILIVNSSTSGQIVYIGDATVTSANGFPLRVNASLKVEIEDSVDIYGISSAASADLRIIEGS